MRYIYHILLICLCLSFTFTKTPLIENKLAGTAYAKSNGESYFDYYLENTLHKEFNWFELKNIAWIGLDKTTPYLVNMAYIEYGTRKNYIGFKKSFFKNEIGSYPKLSSDPLKRQKKLFFKSDYAYRDRLADQPNTLYTDYYIPLDAIYGETIIGPVKIKARTFSTTEANCKNVSKNVELQFLKNNVYELSTKTGNWKQGLLFIPGSLGTYYGNDIDIDLNSDGSSSDDKYKSAIIYGLADYETKFNLSIYNSQYIHYGALQHKITHENSKYIIYYYQNFISKAVSLYLAKDWEKEIYMYYSYDDLNDPAYFLSIGDTQYLNIGRFHWMGCYRKVRKDSTKYNAIVFNIGMGFETPMGELDISVGNDLFKSVWDAWSTYPEPDNWMIRFDFNMGY